MSSCSPYFQGVSQSPDVTLQLLGCQVNSQITSVEKCPLSGFSCLRAGTGCTDTGLLLSQWWGAGALKLVVGEKERKAQMILAGEHFKRDFQERDGRRVTALGGVANDAGQARSIASSVFDERAVSKRFSEFRANVHLWMTCLILLYMPGQ